LILYLDSNAIIYALETPGVARATVIEHVVRACLAPGGLVITSRLAQLECRVKPLRDKNSSLLAQYDSFFVHSDLLLAEVISDVLELATQLRADLGFRTPDAIHLATALNARATVFLTGDVALTRCPGIRIEVVKP